jgi:ribose transport system ATP-binding protein
MSNYLEMKGIVKKFDENIVLNNIDFSVKKGEIHALVGENGAGKSTLMKILAGFYMPDSGEIIIDGKNTIINNPKKSQESNIAIIHQEIWLFPDLSVMENIFLRREPIKKNVFMNMIDWKKAYNMTLEYLDKFSMNINPKTLVNTLSVGQQKFVEIIRALNQNANIIIMDEPTAALTEQETYLLFLVIKELKKLGVTVIYISHRLDEVLSISESITVIREGKKILTNETKNIKIEDIIKGMAGKNLEDKYPKLNVTKGKTLLKVENLSYDNRIKNINFEAKKGEILGITGLSGSGRRTLAKVLFGIEKPYEGNIYINGKKFKKITPDLAKSNGLCYVTDIGTKEGLLNELSVEKNISLTNLKKISKLGFLSKNSEDNYTKKLIEQLEISENLNEKVSSLSGGKKKKVIFAKWLFTNSNVLIIEEPTAGIDIISKIDIYNIINELLISGATIIVLSSDFSEIMGMCDRIMIMFNGEIKKTYNRDDCSLEKILYYASGSDNEEHNRT